MALRARLIMEDEGSNSNDVEAVECVDIDSQGEDDPDAGEKRPIMLLLRRLIRNKHNTVMTNAQIIDILQSEFDINVQSIHELEVDIYIKIIKKFLKDWPQWEELERISTKLNNIKDYEAITKVLNHKYKNLKEYLGVMLEAAKPLAKDAVKTVTAARANAGTGETSKADENAESNEVMMEVQCTKDQLNHLFFRRPRLDLNNTVFNMCDVAPSRISLKRLSFPQIIKGWCIKVNINLPHFLFMREVQYKLNHNLVNRVRNDKTIPDARLDTEIQTLHRDQNNKNGKEYSLDLIIRQFKEILSAYSFQSKELYDTLNELFDILITELNDTFDGDDTYKVPANYKRYSNEYRYVRYLYAENDQNLDPKYDLQLEETVAPLYLYLIGRIGKMEKIPPISDWLSFECMFCLNKIPMDGCMKENLEAHFNDVHQHEPDWQCTHCQKVFGIDYLCENKWFHEC